MKCRVEAGWNFEENCEPKGETVNQGETRPDILVVDDNPDNLNLLQELLGSRYRVRPAPSGRLALKAAESDPPDLVLLDVMMPDMDGYEVCRLLKMGDKTRDIPIIFLTALDEDCDEERGFRLGAVDYITKPIRPSVVLARVHTHLRLREQLERLEQTVSERTSALQRSRDTQAVLNQLLRLCLEDLSLEDLLGRALDLILSVHWLVLEAKGGVFLAEGETLALVVQRGMPPEVLERCGRVPFGTCLCGRAAAGRNVQFSENVDGRHDVTWEGMPGHGHYCVPMVNSDGLLGILALYLPAGHGYNPREESFLVAVADTLSLIVQRRRSDEAVRNALNEKEVLLEELQHRVGNNLQTILSLMALQEADLDDLTATCAYAEIRHKIGVMALIQEKLAQRPGLARFGAAAFLWELVGYTVSGLSLVPLPVTVETSGADCLLDLKRAVPLGLLLNEYICATVRGAEVMGGEPMQIRMALENVEGVCRLRMGPGGWRAGDPQFLWKRDALSLRFMQALARQTGGPLEIVGESEFCILLGPVGETEGAW